MLYLKKKHLRLLYFFIVFLFLFTQGSSCSKSGGENKTVQNYGKIDGVVKNSVTGDPVNNAVIKTTDGLHQVKSDENGYFIMEMPVGKHNIHAEAQGFTSDIEKEVYVYKKDDQTDQYDFFLTPSEINNRPDAPILLSPQNYAIDVSLKPRFQTEPFTDPDAENTHFQTEWQLSKTDTFISPLIFIIDEVLLTELAYESELESGTTYYWRVKFYDNLYSASDWSAVYSFTTKSRPEDNDEDGMPDDWEEKFGMNTTLDDSSENFDGDNITNYEEYLLGTDPSYFDSPSGAGIPGYIVINLKDSESNTLIEKAIVKSDIAVVAEIKSGDAVKHPPCNNKKFTFVISSEGYYPKTLEEVEIISLEENKQTVFLTKIDETDMDGGGGSDTCFINALY